MWLTHHGYMPENQEITAGRNWGMFLMLVSRTTSGFIDLVLIGIGGNSYGVEYTFINKRMRLTYKFLISWLDQFLYKHSLMADGLL